MSKHVLPSPQTITPAAITVASYDHVAHIVSGAVQSVSIQFFDSNGKPLLASAVPKKTVTATKKAEAPTAARGPFTSADPNLAAIMSTPIVSGDTTLGQVFQRALDAYVAATYPVTP